MAMAYGGSLSCPRAFRPLVVFERLGRLEKVEVRTPKLLCCFVSFSTIAASAREREVALGVWTAASDRRDVIEMKWPLFRAAVDAARIAPDERRQQHPVPSGRRQRRPAGKVNPEQSINAVEVDHSNHANAVLQACPHLLRFPLDQMKTRTRHPYGAS